MQQQEKWQDDYKTILEGLSPAQIKDFQADPETLLQKYDTSIGALTEDLLSDEQDLDLARLRGFGSDADASIELHWWGVQFILNEAATKLTEQGSSGLSGLTTVIAAVGATIPGFGTAFAAVAGSFAGALQMQSAAIQFVDQGAGVHFNWTWAQLAVMTVPGLNAAVIASMLVPFSNGKAAARRSK
ncbi:MAG: hypothetical protein R6X02_21665 [Enhygromyxa sp.]